LPATNQTACQNERFANAPQAPLQAGDGLWCRNR
jgi:hypothetical protein